MTDKQITALAREYAEWVIEAEGGDNAYIPAETAIASAFLRWLLRRYCLVEKSKVDEAYLEAKVTTKEGYKAKLGGMIAVGEASKELLKSLFPDLGKEVEG